ncbi:hypothetical protein BDV36DRAFT_152115 [Aspergillus pseudocaelatus]|uniref:Uncharacterized protein n=1 Tax=Aspergillus pseudocaelatus TaxID=1825620 RepID=A0ABQ6WNM3_9EURO|nr:hypothetical protein BDV36DRAFT_152115 [Aspergillus pseudocaelatus]
MGLRVRIPGFIRPIETQLPGLNSAASFTVFFLWFTFSVILQLHYFLSVAG